MCHLRAFLLRTTLAWAAIDAAAAFSFTSTHKMHSHFSLKSFAAISRGPGSVSRQRSGRWWPGSTTRTSALLRMTDSGEKDYRDLRCTCGQVMIRLGGSKSVFYAVNCACGDCRSGNALGMVQEGKGVPARGHVPGYPLDALYVPDDLSVLQGKDKLVAFKLKEPENDDGVRSTRLYASCCWTTMAVTHPDYRGWVACLRKHLVPNEDVPPAQYRIFTKYLEKYLDEDEIAKLPEKEAIFGPPSSLDRQHPWLRAYIRLAVSLKDIDQRRKGSSIQQLIQEAGPMRYMGVPTCRVD